jgi:hypothetical protein
MSTPAPTATTTTTPSKFLRAIMLPYADQQTLLNIYKFPVVDSGDVVDMHGNINNLASTKQLARSTGATFGGTFVSLSAIQQYAPVIKSNGGTQIGYDLEKSLSPTTELANPVASMTTASNIAHKNGLKFMCVPSKQLTKTYAMQFAKVCDVYNLMVQALESNPSTYSNFVHSMTATIKAAHPGILVIAETSTERGTVQQMEQSFASVADVVDGSASWYAADSTGLTALRTYLSWFVSHYG